MHPESSQKDIESHLKVSFWPTAEKNGANIYTRCIVAFWP